MESTNQSSLFELSVDHDSIDHLTETARWAKFLAIAGFVGIGLMLVLSFVFGAIVSTQAFSQLQGVNGGAAGALGGAMFLGIFLIYSAILFFPCLFLYQFSTRLRTALQTNDQVKLNQSLKSQKFLFRYVGIFTIIMLSLYGISLLIFGAIALFIPRP
jgi:hypothetical protein